MRKLLLLFIMIMIAGSSAYSQEVLAVNAGDAQKKLIDEFVAVSNLRICLLKTAELRLFIKSGNYKGNHIDLKLTNTEKQAILKNMYKNYSRREFYYTELVSLDEEALKALIAFYKKNRNIASKGEYFFASVVMFHNLDNDLDAEIESILKARKS